MSKISPEQFKEKLILNLIKSAKEMSAGSWPYVVDREEDSFTWRSPDAKTNEDSIYLSLDDNLSICINPDTAEIQYFFVEYLTEYVKDNPPLRALIEKDNFLQKSFARKVKGSIDKVKVNTAVDSLIAKFLRSYSTLNLAPA